MPEIVTSNSSIPVVMFKSSHIAHSVVDNSAIPAPTLSSATGHLFTVVYTDRGITDRLMTFNNNNNGYNDMLTMFGEPNIRRLGLSYHYAVEHIKNGGDVSLISVKDETAKKSCFILYLKIVEEDSGGNPLKVLIGHRLKDGTGFTTMKENPDPTTYDPVKMTTFSYEFSYEENIAGVTSEDELELLISSKLKTAKATKTYPLIYGMYNGRGTYGNNYTITFMNQVKTISGRPYFETRIYDRRTNGTIMERHNTSLNQDKDEGGSSIYIGAPFNNIYRSMTNGSFNVKAIDDQYLNDLGEMIYDKLNALKPFVNPTIAGPEAEAFVLRIENLKKNYAPDPYDKYHRMRYFNITDASSFEPYLFFPEDDPMNVAPDIDFNGGDNGVLIDMKYFDWQFTVSPPTGDEYKPLQKMFAAAFEGVTDDNIYDYLRNPCDYTIDFGFPDVVKAALNVFGIKRSETQVILNAPITVDRNSAAIEWKLRNNYEDRNRFYLAANFEIEDPVLEIPVRVPSSGPLMYNILNLYQKGFDQSLAHVNFGTLNGVNPFSGRAAVGKLAQTDSLLNAGFNHFVETSSGYKLDSQISNYKLTEVSSLQEFHNNCILNRTLKILYRALLSQKHTLVNENTIMQVDSLVNNELAEIRTKVNYLNVEVGYESNRDMAIGLMRIGLNFGFFNSNKYFFIIATADAIA